MKTRCKKITPIVAGAAALITLASCGKADEFPRSIQPIKDKQTQVNENEKTFMANLTGINSSVSGSPTGTAMVTINGDTVSVQVEVNGAPLTMHAQHIHTGSRCAGTDADVNNDGILDMSETSQVAGEVLIPLDADLSSQMSGIEDFENGSSYNYSQTASLTEMLNDLTSPDTDPDDNVVKLPSGTTDIGLEGKVIEIHGVPDNTTLPGTVASGEPGKTPQESLPIACGVLRASDDPTNSTTTGSTGGETTGTTTGGKGGGGKGGSDTTEASNEQLPGEFTDGTTNSF